MSRALPDSPPARFRDRRLPLADRLDDLLDALTTAEKLALLHQYQPAIPRLGIGSFRTGAEALHGMAWLGPATVFPQAVGLASGWDTDLMNRVGAAVGEEARGFHHKDPTRAGLNVWAPVVNPLRDPRWGRNEEGYSEDPLLTAVLATAYAGGLRGDHPRYLRTAPTLKHFLAYNNEVRRDTTSSNMPPRVLHEYELPAFRGPIAAGAAVAVMASYNLVNGRPAHLSRLINDELRSWTSDDLLLVSDAQAPSNVVTAQHYHPDHATSHAALIKSGIDSFTDNNDDVSITVDRVTEAVRRGLISQPEVDRAVRHILAIRFRLGEFDPPGANPYAATTDAVINCEAHRALARQAARQAIVLLKNGPIRDTATLPLDAGSLRRVAVIGPLADTVQQDWYSGTLPYAYSALDGITAHLGDAVQVDFVEGADLLALRVGGRGGPLSGRYVTGGATPGGSPLRAQADSAEPDAVFAAPDWGRDLIVLRATANGRYVTVDDSATLVNTRPQPGGWHVRELFELVPLGSGEVVLRHVTSQKYITVDLDGQLHADARTAADACDFVVESVRDTIAEAGRAAAAADVAVLIIGNHPMINGRETEDRLDLELPAAQDRLVRAVVAANERTVLVVNSSYPYAISWADEHVPAIVWSAHGGQEFGRALADVLFGVVSPAGHLTQTWYRSAADLPDMLDYDVIAADATYLYFRGDPLYPFGHGLTYTTVAYRDLRLSAGTVGPGDEVTVSVQVHNTGDRDADEVVQLYTRQRQSVVKQPVRRLRDFRRISLAPGEVRTVELHLNAADLAFWDVTRGRYAVESATHAVLVGRSSADIRVCGTLTVSGEAIPDRDPLRGPLAAADHDDYAGVVVCDADRTDADRTDADRTDADRDGAERDGAGLHGPERDDPGHATSGPGHADAVTAVEPGGWIAFHHVDFAGGPATCRARLARAGGGPAIVTLRLDDPLAGTILATLATTGRPEHPHRPQWTVAEAALPAVAGVRDLYAVFAAPGVALRTLSFTAEARAAGGGGAR